MTPDLVPTHPESLVRRLIGQTRGSREMAAVAYFDPEWRLLAARHSTGGRSHLVLPVRTVVHDALGFAATYIVLVHTHPSGDPTPSGADLAYTRILARTLDAVAVTLFDHLVIAGAEVTSMRAIGML